MRLLIGLIVAISALVQCRVRLEGHLPRHRGATLVVANHLHDLDGMIVPVWLSAVGPWCHPIYYAASQRLFEPGFLAMRFPVFRRWISRVNLAGLFHVIGLRPIENQPLSRPIASYAYQILRTFGPRLLGEVFTEAAIEHLGLKPVDPLKALWNHKVLEKSMAPASLQVIQKQLRPLIQSVTRTVLKEQLEALVREVRMGGTLYITPEGRYSDDGYLHRFRMAWEPLYQESRRHFIAAITYDPFAHRRLSMWGRLLEVPPNEDLPRFLRANRTITVSALILHAFRQSPNYSPTDLIQFVKDKIRWIEKDVAIAPELRKHPTRAIRRAVNHMLRTGVLEQRGSSLRLGSNCQHPRFPNVPDIVSFFDNTLADTLAAAAERKQLQSLHG